MINTDQDQKFDFTIPKNRSRKLQKYYDEIDLILTVGTPSLTTQPITIFCEIEEMKAIYKKYKKYIDKEKIILKDITDLKQEN